MARKKKEEEEVKTVIPQKKTIKPKTVNNNVEVEIEKYSISELLRKNNIKPILAVGFLKQYGLIDDFRREFEDKEAKNKFSQGEFDDMYKRYMKRGI